MAQPFSILGAALAAVLFAGSAMAQQGSIVWLDEGYSGEAIFKGPYCSKACPQAINIAKGVCDGRGKVATFPAPCACPEAKSDNGVAHAPFACK